MVYIENETDFSNPEFDIEKTAEEVISTILSLEGCPKECEVELLITDPESVREINNEYRQIDNTTDVLSFPNVAWDMPSDFGGEAFNDTFLINPDSKKIMLGQIVLNDERIVSQAESYNHSVKREYAFLIAHSVLHLLGYDHMEDTEREIMEAKQREYLDKMGIVR